MVNSTIIIDVRKYSNIFLNQKKNDIRPNLPFNGNTYINSSQYRYIDSSKLGMSVRVIKNLCNNQSIQCPNDIIKMILCYLSYQNLINVFSNDPAIKEAIRQRAEEYGCPKSENPAKHLKSLFKGIFQLIEKQPEYYKFFNEHTDDPKDFDPDKVDPKELKKLDPEEIFNTMFQNKDSLKNRLISMNNRIFFCYSMVQCRYVEKIIIVLLALGVSEYYKKYVFKVEILRNNVEMIRLLLKYKGIDNINYITDRYENTPLILAAIYGYLEIVEILLDHKANIRIQNNEGKTALDCAAEKSHQNIVNLLTQHANNQVK